MVFILRAIDAAVFRVFGWDKMTLLRPLLMMDGAQSLAVEQVQCVFCGSQSSIFSSDGWKSPPPPRTTSLE